MALGLTQSPTEISTRNISWGVKAAGGVGLTTLPPSCVECLEIWEPQPPGTLGLSRPIMGLLYLFLFTSRGDPCIFNLSTYQYTPVRHVNHSCKSPALTSDDAEFVG